MSKRVRFIILLLVFAFGGWKLYPSVKWYFVLKDEDRALLMIGEEEMYAQSEATKNKIAELKKIRSKTLSLGLDLSGGVYVSGRIDQDDLRQQLMDKNDYDEKLVDKIFENELKEATERAIEVLKNRMDQFGVGSSIIRKTFGNRISIELPGLKNPQRVRDVLKRVGKLEFMLVDEETMEVLKTEHGIQMYAGYVLSRETVPEDFEIPEGSIWKALWGKDNTGKSVLKGWYILKKHVEMDGTSIKNAIPDFDQKNNSYMVGFQLTPEGTDIFRELTGNNIKKRMAIVLDGKVSSAPTIQSEIVGSGQISGNFTFEETKILAGILKSGALRAKIIIMEEKLIGPSLGADSIKNGGMAFIIGTIAVILFMIIYYRTGGLIAFIGLTVNIFFLTVFLAIFKATLTLPGIAGIALTVGMAVDANTIIYERIREEMRRSRSFKHALENGYQHASITIWDSNLTTLIAAFALASFGTKDIQGFGITLAFGIISNIFSALFVTRLLFDWLIDTFRLKKISL